MMRRKICLTLASALCLMAAMQVRSESKSPLIALRAEGIAHSALFGLAFDRDRGVAVGAGGAVLSSTDGGLSWRREAQSATELALLAVARSGTHTIAVGQMGTILLQGPQGWQRVDSGVPARLLSIGVNANGIAVAGGQFGTVLRSSDGGNSWTSAAPDWLAMASADHFGTGEPTIYAAVVENSGRVTIAGEFGVIMRSEDGGKSWRTIRPVDPAAPTLSALYITAAGSGNSYAVGQSGELLVSGDGGETWQRRPTPTDHNLLGVAALPDGQVVVTGMRAMLRSTDAGASWQLVREGDSTTDWYQAVRALDGGGRVIAVGHSGRIIQIGG